MAKTKVKRRNRVLIVDEHEVDSYLKQGYDEININTSEVIQRATGGRTISLAEHNKVLDELEELKGTDVNAIKDENEKLKKKNTALKSQLTKLQNAKDKK